MKFLYPYLDKHIYTTLQELCFCFMKGEDSEAERGRFLIHLRSGLTSASEVKLREIFSHIYCALFYHCIAASYGFTNVLKPRVFEQRETASNPHQLTESITEAFSARSFGLICQKFDSLHVE